MRLKTALPILWLPLIGVWSFLLSVQLNKTSTELESIVPLISYILVSFLLVLQLQLVIGNKREVAIVKLGTANVLLTCLVVATTSILLNLFNAIQNELSVGIVVSSLIVNTILAEIFSASSKQVIKQKDKLVKKKEAWVQTNREIEEKQINASEEKARKRNSSLRYRQEWKKYLKQASIDYLDNKEIIEEITRIKEIVEFSSYFRESSCMLMLSKLQSSLDPDQVIIILAEVK
ncbi:hypothetical protein [Prochlorococcus sp. MIT 1223]|uniref:hypothetical protein n=1 Tax=Prochlorococcus sp. MIT 1223 TaxID=3096217 RepID=UPI002A759B36|nr:hypothetical protein [Prochlorococcus sp. MIT 1223]